jgi:O-antigen/teichoic acid export membrane protein
MRSPIIWVFARIALLVLGVISFAGFVHHETNFGPIGGLVCGAGLFLFVLFTVTQKTIRREEIFSLSSPFWPPWKYVQGYWFTTGCIVFISSSVNLIFHLGDSSATGLYLGLTFFGVGWLAGAMLARYRLSKT